MWLGKRPRFSSLFGIWNVFQKFKISKPHHFKAQVRTHEKVRMSHCHSLRVASLSAQAPSEIEYIEFYLGWASCLAFSGFKHFKSRTTHISTKRMRTHAAMHTHVPYTHQTASQLCFWGKGRLCNRTKIVYLKLLKHTAEKKNNKTQKQGFFQGDSKNR